MLQFVALILLVVRISMMLCTGDYWRVEIMRSVSLKIGFPVRHK